MILLLLALYMSGCGYFRYDKLTIGVWETAPEDLLSFQESESIIFWKQFKWTSPVTGKYIPYRTELTVINGYNTPVTYRMTKKGDETTIKYYATDKDDPGSEDGTYYVIDDQGNLQEYNNYGHLFTYKVTESIDNGVKNLN